MSSDSNSDTKKFDSTLVRLSDRILFALNLALDQEDVTISNILVKALDLSMTRHTGGGEFVERRDYPQEVEVAMDRLAALRKKQK